MLHLNKLFWQATAVLAFVCLSVVAFSQNRTISGIVRDADNGEPIPGANIMVKGTARGTYTDENGGYNLQMSSGETIVISFTGYQKHEEIIDNQTDISVLLSPSVGLNDLVVTGTRTPGRSSTETVAPVDIIPMKEVTNSIGQVDLGQILQFIAPSFNANRQAGSDGSDHIDAASLRGLGPDQVLVLINGKRRHTSSLVNVFGTRGRGNVGTDLNAIPVGAIERIEILRDGAAAQYGSDAIAGVINLVLKENVNELSANLSTGFYTNQEDKTTEKWVDGTELAKRKKGASDGFTYMLNTNYGVGIGNDGFVNFTGEFTHRDRTDRAPAGNRRTIGDSQLDNSSLFFNAEIPLAGQNSQFYAFGGLNFRNGLAGAWYRSPDDDRNIPEIYPLGFVPQIRTNILDKSFTAGFRSQLKKWNLDISNAYGKNTMRYFVEGSLNRSLGLSTPTNFDAGGFGFSQNTTNINLDRRFKILEGLNVAFGAEHRLDSYNLFAGEEESWKKYGTGDEPGGAQGFPGFRPDNEVNKSRSNVATYVDTELDIIKDLTVAAAVRLENYSDFGDDLLDATIFKIGARYQPIKYFGLRTAFNTGFRAPSLQQRYFSSTYTEFVQGVANDVVISPNDGIIAKGVGVPSLTQEKSTNFSAGIVSKPITDLTITADFYSIDVKDRIILTGYFDGSDESLPIEVRNVIANSGAALASFFSNSVDTRTMGLDLVASYRAKLGKGVLNANLAYNYNKTEVLKVKIPAKLAGFEDTYFGVREKYFVSGSAPVNKTSFMVTYTWNNKVSAMVRAVNFGKIVMGTWSGTDADGKLILQNLQPKTSIDASITWHPTKNLQWTIGGSNLTNAYPTKSNPDETESGGLYEAVQMGFNGTYLFTRLGFNF